MSYKDLNDVSREVRDFVKDMDDFRKEVRRNTTASSGKPSVEHEPPKNPSPYNIDDEIEQLKKQMDSKKAPKQKSPYERLLEKQKGRKASVKRLYGIILDRGLMPWIEAVEKKYSALGAFAKTEKRYIETLNADPQKERETWETLAAITMHAVNGAEFAEKYVGLFDDACKNLKDTLGRQGVTLSKNYLSKDPLYDVVSQGTGSGYFKEQCLNCNDKELLQTILRVQAITEIMQSPSAKGKQQFFNTLQQADLENVMIIREELRKSNSGSAPQPS